MSIGDKANMRVIWQNGVSGSLAYNVLTYEITAQTGDDLAAWNGVAAALYAAIFPAAVQALYAETTILQSVDWYGLTQETQAGSVTANVPGTGSGDILPLRTAPTAEKFTGMRGRHYRGRVYMPAPLETQQAGGILVGGYVTAMDAALEASRALTSGSGSAKMVLTSTFRDSEGNVERLEFNDVVSFTVRAVLSSVRRRQK